MLKGISSELGLSLLDFDGFSMTESHGTLQKQEAKGAANKVEKL